MINENIFEKVTAILKIKLLMVWLIHCFLLRVISEIFLIELNDFRYYI